MNYLKNAWKHVLGMNFAHLLVLCLVIKSIVDEINYSAFLICIPVLGYEAYKLYLKSKEPNKVEIDAELRKELENIKARLNANQLEKAVQPKQFKW